MTRDRDWMRPVLAWLFAAIDSGTAQEAVLSDSRRSELRNRINREIRSPAGSSLIPDGSRGDNLFQGLLALRMKFEQATAMAKLEKNLAMRAEKSDRH